MLEEFGRALMQTVARFRDLEDTFAVGAIHQWLGWNTGQAPQVECVEGEYILLRCSLLELILAVTAF